MQAVKDHCILSHKMEGSRPVANKQLIKNFEDNKGPEFFIAGTDGKKCEATNKK